MEAVRILAAGFLVLGLWGCGPKYITTHQTPGVEKQLIEQIAVLPIAKDPARDRNGEVLRTGKVEEGGPLIITALLYEKLRAYKGLTLLSRIEVDKTVDRIAAEQPDLSLTEQARKIGEELKVSAVLAGHVYAFIEREGGAYGIRRPASVGFELLLINVKEGQVLWKGSYYETQQSLFSDISTFSLFMKRKGRWQTATELADYGMEEVLAASPWATMD
jgi:hypothetical protein